MRVQVKMLGDSASVTIPASIMESAQLEVNDTVEISELGGKIVISPVDRVEYDVNDLIAAITPENRHEEISFGNRVGRELL